MLWFVVFAVLVLLGLGVLALIGWSLVRKFSALTREVGGLGEHVERVGELLDQLEIPDDLAYGTPTGDDDRAPSRPVA